MGAAAAESSALDDAVRLAEHVIAEGIAHLGAGEKLRFARVRAALEAGQSLWPGVLIDDLEIAIEAYQNRSARYRTAEVAFLLASLAARATAVAQGGELPKRFLLGTGESPVTALDHVRLVSLGARIDADEGARLASVYLADPDSGIVLVASRRFDFAADQEPEEGPALAKRSITGTDHAGFARARPAGDPRRQAPGQSRARAQRIACGPHLGHSVLWGLELAAAGPARR